MTQATKLQCMICGGDHEPSFANCDDAGMDEQIKKMGDTKWRRLTAMVSRQNNRRNPT